MDFLNIEDNENRENNLPQNQEERDSLFWSRFHQENSNFAEST